MKIIVIMLFACWVNAAPGQEKNRLVQKGNEYYYKNDFEKARESYLKALQKDQTNPVAQFNSGNALQQLKEFEEAVKMYESAAINSPDPVQKAMAYYNQGLAFLQLKKLTEAIESFKKSVRLNSNDTDARENLQKALNELKSQQQQQRKNEENQNPEIPKKQQQKNQQKLSREQAEKLLDELEKEEKNTRSQLQKKIQQGRQQKDW